jgi:hypothetical protein
VQVVAGDTFTVDHRSHDALWTNENITTFVESVKPFTTKKTKRLRVLNGNALFDDHHSQIIRFMRAFPLVVDVEMHDVAIQSQFWVDHVWAHKTTLERLVLGGKYQDGRRALDWSAVQPNADLTRHARLVDLRIPSLTFEYTNHWQKLLAYQFAPRLERLQCTWAFSTGYERMAAYQLLEERCTRLTHFSLTLVSPSSEAEYITLHLPLLTHLQIDILDGTEAVGDYKWLSTFPLLEELVLPQMTVNETPKDQLDALDAFLVAHPRLRVLCLGSASEPNLVARVAAHCPHMETLTFDPHKYTRADAKELAGWFTKLPRLIEVGQGEFRDWRLCLPHLSQLRLVQSTSDVVVWSALSTLRRLRVLCLENEDARMDDEHLQALGRYNTNLRYLRFRGKGRVSDTGLQALARGCPDLQIVRTTFLSEGGPDAASVELSGVFSYETLRVFVTECKWLEMLHINADWANREQLSSPDYFGATTTTKHFEVDWARDLYALVWPGRLSIYVSYAITWGTRRFLQSPDMRNYLHRPTDSDE